MKTSFELVSMMNTAFGNPKGDPLNIDWTKVRRQFKNVGHEFCELLQALGLDPACVENILGAINRNTNPEQFTGEPNLHKVRDASRDIVVFADGGHHFMGIDGDRDMKAVIDGVMTRFVRDEADKERTQAVHAAAGVTEVYFEGEYPTMIMKSAADQPDAPKGKFLKSASYKDTVFYDVTNPEWCPGCTPSNCAGCATEASATTSASSAEDAGADTPELTTPTPEEDPTCPDCDASADDCECDDNCYECDRPVEDCECAHDEDAE